MALLGVLQRQGLGWVLWIREECTEPGWLCAPLLSQWSRKGSRWLLPWLLGEYFLLRREGTAVA